MPRIFIREPNHFYTYELPVVLGEEVIVGAAPTCQLALPGVAGLSRVHARVVCRQQGYVIEDLQSQYGTLQNGRPVQAEYMVPGAEYMLGTACIVLDPESVAARAQEPVQESTPTKPKVRKAPVMKKNVGGVGSSGAGSGDSKIEGAELSKLAKKYDRSGTKGGSRLTVVDVVLLLLIAFYAGVALRHWERTGNYLPGILSDGGSTRL